MDETSCVENAQVVPRRPKEYLIATFGAPGSGKSTVCQYLAMSLGIDVVSPGRELRRLVARHGPVGEAAEWLIRTAALVPKEMLWWMLTEHGSNGLILDGVPQDVDQVNLVAEFATHYGYRLIGVHLIVPEPLALERIASRWYCERCLKAAYRGNPVCDCGAPLYQRLDDTLAVTVAARFRRYQDEVVPAANFFKGNFDYSEFNADCDLDEVFLSVTKWIEFL